MLLTPDKARLLLDALAAGPPDPLDEVADLDKLRYDLERVATTPTDRPDSDLGRIRGAGDGRGPGVTPFDPDTYRTVILDAVGAVAMRLAPSGELALYLELAGRVNKRQQRDEGAYLLTVGQAAELVADVIVAAQASSDEFARELEAAIDREQARRGLSRRA